LEEVLVRVPGTFLLPEIAQVLFAQIIDAML